jgi:drug/metabolite transporter (DMT)-like permease
MGKITTRAVLVLLTFYFLTQGLQVLPLVEVGLIMNTFPLFTAVLGFLILKDRLKVLEIFCLFVSFLGVYLLVMGDNKEDIHKDI